MLTVIIRAFIIFVILLVVIRLMGKRQIGEMEPFELTITLVIADLACIPMSDKSIPLTYGITSILCLYVIHQIIVLLSRKSKKFQNVLSGKPVIVIDKKGIRLDALRKMNMHTNDLLQAMRAAGYFSIEQVAYAIFETNGQLSVIPNEGKETAEPSLPVPFIVDGQWSEEDLTYYNLDRKKLESMIESFDLKTDKLILATIDDKGKMLLYPEQARCAVIKQFLATLFIMLVLIAAGLTEIFVMQNNFGQFGDRLSECYEKAVSETLTEKEFDELDKYWINLRENIEFFINHQDFTEVDLRMAECKVYVAEKNFQSAAVQIGVIIEMTKHIPHTLLPTPEHIL